jgi:hypothetical protein
MPNGTSRPWYKKPLYLAAIIGVIGVILAAIIGVSYEQLFWGNPPPSDFSISTNPMHGAVQPDGVIKTDLCINCIHGYEHQVSLKATGQPSGVVVSFAPSIVGPTPLHTSTANIKVGSSVPVGVYTINIEGLGADGREHICHYILTVNPRKVISPPTTTPSPTPSSTSSPTPSSTTSPTTFLPLYVSEAFYPSGWMGDWGDITFDGSYTDDPFSEPDCIQIIYSADSSQGSGWASIYWQHPSNNWGDLIGGYDLTGATRLTFRAKGENGEEKAEFKVGGIEGEYPDSVQPAVSTGIIVLSDNWQQYTIDLSSEDLSHIIGGFCWATNKAHNPHGCRIYLDEIRYE